MTLPGALTSCPFCGGRELEPVAEEPAPKKPRSLRRIPNRVPEVWYTEELELMQVLSRQHGIPSISLDDFEIEAAVTDLVPLAFVREHRLIPINRIGTTLIIAMVDPSNVHALAALFEQTGLRIDPVLASEPELARAIRRHYRHGPDPSRRNR